MQIDAVEEAFICGDWAQVLQQSREKLLARVAVTEDPQDEATMQAQEALVSMYLQSVFELAAHDELDTSFALIQSLSPLPFHVSLQWIKFLIAMDRRSDALESLNDLLQQCSTKLAVAPQDEWASRYVQATEVLVLLVLLPSESSIVVRNYIAVDRVLDQATKQRLLQAVDAKEATASATLAAKDVKPTTALTSSRANSSTNGSVSTTTHSTKQKPPALDPRADSSDPAADLAAIGGTALAVAAVAIGVYHYRDRLRDAVAEIGPAVSKGLADAKYALFES